MLTFSDANKSFAADASGYVRSEGAAAIVLKASDAHRLAGIESPIYAKVLGSAMNQDGKSASFTAPNGTAQRELLTSALAKCNLSPDDVDYIETHGTGTALGDPIEWGAIRSVYLEQSNRSEPLVVGAVKSHIGHLEGCAGLAGLIKVLMSFKSGCVPSNLHSETLSPAISMTGLSRPALFPSRPVQLPSHKRAVAGISSFGSGGTNVHVLLQQSQQNALFGGFIRPSLTTTHTVPQVVYAFSGQTPINIPLLRDLFESSERFRALVEECSRSVSLNPNLSTALTVTSSCLPRRTSYNHLLLFALQVYLSEFWQSSGESCSIVLGHSFGEYAMSVFLGVLSLDTAARLVFCRAQLLEAFSEKDCKMVAVRATREDVQSAMTALGLTEENCSIAAINGQKSVVLSGDVLAIDKVIARLGCSNKDLGMEYAYHSAKITKAADAFKAKAEEIIRSSVHTSTVRDDCIVYSCLTGQLCAASSFATADYWHKQMVSSVLFASCVTSIVQPNTRVFFLELGMENSLTSLIKSMSISQIDSQVACLPSFDRNAIKSELAVKVRKMAILLNMHQTTRVAKGYKPLAFLWRNVKDKRVTASSIIVAPEGDNDLEKLVLNTVREYVDNPSLTINGQSVFANLGIDSLSAISMRNSFAKELQVPSLPSTIVLQCGNVEKLVKYLCEVARSIPSPSLLAPSSSDIGHKIVYEEDEAFEASSTQLSMMFHHVADPLLGSFIETFEWKAYGSLDVDRFYEAWRAVAFTFPAFRTSFNPYDLPVATQTIISIDQAERFNAPREESTWFRVVDLSSERTTYEDIIDSTIFSERKSLQQLDNPPLFSLVLFVMPTDSEYPFHFLFTIHHLLIDGDSLCVVLKRLCEHYTETKLIKVATSFHKVVQREHKLKASEELLLYWQQLGNSVPRKRLLEFPVWKLDLCDEEVIREFSWIEANVVESLVGCARECHVTLCSFMQAVFSIAYSSVIGSHYFTYGNTHNGRMGLGEEVVGPCVNLFPVFFNIESDALLKDYVMAVHSQLLKSLDHGCLPLLDILRASSHRTNVFSLIFDYQVEGWNFELSDGVRFKFERLMDRVGCPLSVRVLRKDKEILITAVSESSLYDQDFVCRLVQAFTSCLKFAASAISDSAGALEALRVKKLESISKMYDTSSDENKFDRIFPTNDTVHVAQERTHFNLNVSISLADPGISVEVIMLFIFGASLLKFTSTEDVSMHYQTLNSRQTVYLPIHTDAHHCYVELVHILQSASSVSGLIAPLFSTCPIAELDYSTPIALQVISGESGDRIVYNCCVLYYSSIPAAVVERLIWHFQESMSAYMSGGFHGLTKQIISSFSQAASASTYVPDVPFQDVFMADTLSKREKSTTPCVRSVDSDGEKTSLSYQILYSATIRVAASLVENLNSSFALPENKVPVVAIVMEKGWEQVVAAVAILRIHCAYLPMDAKTWPE
ncbi:acyltransferase domain-containing protein, partial [archaeon]